MGLCRRCFHLWNGFEKFHNSPPQSASTSPEHISYLQLKNNATQSFKTDSHSVATFNQLPSLSEMRHLEISVALQSLDDSLIDNAPCMYTVSTLGFRETRSWGEASEGE